MKKNILPNLTFILLGLVVALALNASADTWAGPTGSAPANNIAAPLHVGPDQIKAGGLSVGTLAVAQNAEFEQQVFFNGMIRGGNGSTADSKVSFGDTAHIVNGTVKGDVNATGTLTSAQLANSSSTSVCAATDGTISLCGAATAQKQVYTVPAQTLVYPMPDYAYTPGGQKYILSVCVSSPAQLQIPFTIRYTDPSNNTTNYGNLTINAGQNCAQTPIANGSYAVLSAPATQVPPATNQCTYETSDPTYQATPYQGYSVSVDPSIQCH